MPIAANHTRVELRDEVVLARFVACTFSGDSALPHRALTRDGSEAVQPPLRPLAAALPSGRGALHHPIKARAPSGVAAAAVAGDADLEEDGVLVAVDAGLDDALELAAR